MQINIQNCARCNKDHHSLTFKKFSLPVEKTCGEFITPTHFAICPNSDEPVLLYTKESDFLFLPKSYKIKDVRHFMKEIPKICPTCQSTCTYYAEDLKPTNLGVSQCFDLKCPNCKEIKFQHKITLNGLIEYQVLPKEGNENECSES